MLFSGKLECCGFSKAGFSWDDFFAFRVPRTVRIRDRRIGFTLRLLQLAVFLYVLVYQILSQKVYLQNDMLVTACRVQLLRPSHEYSFEGLHGALPPYCHGSTESSAPFIFPDGNSYQLVRREPPIDPASPKGQCLYLDSRFAVTTPTEESAVFMPTRITVIHEEASPAGECDTMGKLHCTYEVVDSTLTYVVDMEMFTAWIDHSFTTPKLGLSISQLDMKGKIVDSHGRIVDPCGVYLRLGKSCPDFISVGNPGSRDIVAVQTILEAAGIESLDQAWGTKSDGVYTETARYAGAIIVLSITYNNYHTFNPRVVEYTYTATAIPNAEYKGEEAVAPSNIIPSPTRITYNRHGIKLIMNMDGTIGMFYFQAFILNLSVSVGLLSIALILTELLLIHVCPLRWIYRQYALTEAPKLNKLLKSETASKAVSKAFKEDPFLVDPVKKVVLSVMDAVEKYENQSGSKGDVPEIDELIADKEKLHPYSFGLKIAPPTDSASAKSSSLRATSSRQRSTFRHSNKKVKSPAPITPDPTVRSPPTTMDRVIIVKPKGSSSEEVICDEV